MMEKPQFKITIEQTALNILREIENNPHLSSWQLKNKLQISSSLLYMAVGYLINQNKITATPDEMSYKINKNPNNN